MRILFVSHFVPYPPHGGSLQRTFNILKEMSKNNDIYLISLSQRPLISDENILTERIKALTDYCKHIKVFKIPSDYSKFRWYMLLFFNLFSLIPYSVWRFKSGEMAKEIVKILNDNQIDLVHLDTIDLAQYLKNISNVPIVLNHHNVESQLLRRRGINEKNPFSKLYLLLQAWKLKRYEKKNCPSADVNLAVSAEDKKLFESFIPDTRFEIIPNGTDIEYFKPDNKVQSNRLVFAGGLTWYPNKDAMSYFCREIYPLIKKDIPDIEIDIIGRSPASDLVNIARNDQSIKLHGFVDDIRGYVNRAAVYVVPIRVGGGTRLKILDAFACGKALVSTSIGCEGIDATPGENILIGDTTREFADQVIRILKDDRLRKKLEINAREIAAKMYSWKIIGQSLSEIHQSILK